MSKWLTNGLDYSQMAAGTVVAVCRCFHAKKLIILLWEFVIRKASFIVNKQYCLHQKLITSLTEMFRPFANVLIGRNCDHLSFDVTPYDILRPLWGW